ncbi:helix-hairpin-helix domain-containing protein, partial [Prolixibacteraceae bacterium]|nr:helix-hairpin-helix domain-containing protein [Prolixibacteraceae bacterium]
KKTNAKEFTSLYRDRCRYGGFVSWRQVQILCDVSEQTLTFCRKFFYLDPRDIIPIDVNVASYESLCHLPYLKRSDVIAIVDYREEHMGFGSYPEFVSVFDMEEESMSYLKFYVSF